MGYEIYVYFGEKSLDDLSAAIQLTEWLTGVVIPRNDTDEAKLLDIFLQVHFRPPYLKDTSEMPFSHFGYQLDLSRGGHSGLIHQVGFYLAQAYSVRLREKAMLCLSGGEFLGAMFDNGRLIIDHMEMYPKLHYAGPWKYDRDLLL